MLAKTKEGKIIPGCMFPMHVSDARGVRRDIPYRSLIVKSNFGSPRLHLWLVWRPDCTVPNAELNCVSIRATCRDSRPDQKGCEQ